MPPGAGRGPGRAVTARARRAAGRGLGRRGGGGRRPRWPPLPQEHGTSSSPAHCGWSDELHSALRFLHATGSVLHYGSGTRQHSAELEQIVFMQPQFIIDAIKYVVREPEAEDINAELRAMDKQIRNQRDLKSFHQTGELTGRLLREVWGLAKISPSDQRLMLEVMKAFRLLRVLGESGDAQGERYVVPAMLPQEALPAEYVAPHWWCPAKAIDAAGVSDEHLNADASTAPVAAMRVVYEVVGGRLPFSFMSELQVSLAMPGTEGKHFAPEAPVVDSVAGSVLPESYKCGGADVTEWVVVSQHARYSLVGEAAERETSELDLARDSIRVVAWAGVYGLEEKVQRNGRKLLYLSRAAAKQIFGSSVGGYTDRRLWQKGGAIYRRATAAELPKVDKAISCLEQSLARRRAGGDAGHDFMRQLIVECVDALKSCAHERRGRVSA